MGAGLYRNGRHQPITTYEGSWAESMADKRAGVVKIPATRPHSREPIKPVERHTDRKNDYRRKPKNDRQEQDYE